MPEPPIDHILDFGYHKKEEGVNKNPEFHGDLQKRYPVVGLFVEWSTLLYLIAALFVIALGVLIIVGKGLKIHLADKILHKGSESMFVMGFLMGIAPCVPYVAILTYIA
jgi:hypothetical protein